MLTQDTISKVELIYKSFQENPTRITYSTSRLKKQFNATEQEIAQAKHLYKEYPNDYMIALAMSVQSRDIFEDYEDLEDSVTQLNTPDTNPTSLPNYSEEWEVKQKWIKDKEGSKLLVKRHDIDYKKEFQEFVDGYNCASTVYTPSYKDGILFVYTADKHIGAETKINSMLPNEYNAKEFADRMSKVAREVCRLSKLYPLNEIVLVDLGDAVDGYDGKTTRGGHNLPQNMTNREVYQTFLKVHLDFVGTIVDYSKCNQVSYITVGESNHGGDFEWICNKSLETVINLKYPTVKTHIGNKFVEHYIYGDHCFILCHGKDIEDMKYPLSKRLDAKTELWIKSYVDQMGITCPNVHFIKGDLHLASTEYSSFLRYKNCLSIYGSSKWVQTNFMKNTKGVSVDILLENSIIEHNLFL